ncbi:MAG: NADH-quinone oxidoreductase subunit E, partial [Thermoleophilia bacterium]
MIGRRKKGRDVLTPAVERPGAAPLSAADPAEGGSIAHRRPVPRFGHGSRVPGWDDAADLSKDPAPIPDAATTAVPDELRAEIEEIMGRYPDVR